MKKLEIGLGILSFLTWVVHFILKDSGFIIGGVASLVILGAFIAGFTIVTSINYSNLRWKNGLVSSFLLTLGVVASTGFIMYCIFYQGI